MIARTLDVALSYYDRGWSIIPILPGTKKPACASWKAFQTNRADSDQIREWFREREASLAVICGSVSNNLVIRDFDRLDGYEQWSIQNPELAQSLPTVETARGRHVYCRAALDRIITLDDGELRGNGYCLAPPSIHPSGVLYRWLVPLTSDLPTINLQDFACNSENTENTCHELSEVAEFSELSESSEFSKLHGVRVAIRRCLPPGPGHRERKLFELCRELQAIPECNAIKVKDLEPIVWEWHRLALPYIRTKPFTESWFDFRRAWEKVKFPAGTDPVGEAFSRALQREVPHSCRHYDLERVVTLIKLCVELQAVAGSKPFYLDCRTAGRLLGV